MTDGREGIVGPRSDGRERRLLCLAHGSYEAAVVQRNATFRMRDVALDGYFSRVDYVFYRTETSAVHALSPGFTIHDVSGAVPTSLAGNPWTRRAALLASGLGAIERIARAVKPDVIVGAEPFIPGAIALSLAKLRRRPLVISLVSDYRLSFEAAGENPIGFLPPDASFAVESAVLSRADLVMMDTEHYGRYAEKRGTPHERVRVVPRYVAPVYYAGAADPSIWSRLDVPDASPLVYVGRMAPEKYALDLVDALAVVRRRYPERKLVIIGGGQQKDQVFAKARGMGLDGAVLQRTGLTAGEIGSAMAMAGALLVTHGGYALLEACLAGAPIVAYDFEWHPEIITDGETGLLATYRDAQALGQGALRLLDDRGAARRMGEAAQRRGRERYARERNLDAQVALFRELIG